MEGNILFDQFVDVILKEIDSYLPQNENHEVEIVRVNKNNVTLTGLTISREDTPLSPNIYLDQFFEKYQQGESIVDVCSEISRIYVQAPQFEIKAEDFTDYGMIKDKLRLRLVSKENNVAFLEQGPYQKHEMGAVVPYIDISEVEEGSISIRITHHMMDLYGISKEELFAVALENTQEKQPCTLQPMQDVIREMIGDDFIDDVLETEEFPMYVLSNVQRTNGATVVLYPEVLKQIGGELGSNYYVLPSSTHEVLVIPKGMNTPSQKQLRETVQEVNATQVDPVDFLSDNVYEYNSREQTLKKCPINERGLER